MVHNAEGLDKKKTIEGMKHEVEHMKKQGVYSEVNINDLTPEQQATIIESRWVLRDKGDKVRARIVAKGYTEQIEDADKIYASTPIFSTLRILLTMAMAKQWTVKAGDISVAFLHANAATKDLLHVAPTRVLQWLLANSMAITQSNVWTKKFTISMAKSPSTNPTRS